MERDRRGRRRQPEQSRGLQPMHPALPDRWESRAIRASMSVDDWVRLEDLVQRYVEVEPTRARALGATLSELLTVREAAEVETPPLDWLDWERRKTLRLLRPGA